jgi:hypothetical protein
LKYGCSSICTVAPAGEHIERHRKNHNDVKKAPLIKLSTVHSATTASSRWPMALSPPDRARRGQRQRSHALPLKLSTKSAAMMSTPIATTWIEEGTASRLRPFPRYADQQYADYSPEGTVKFAHIVLEC